MEKHKRNLEELKLNVLAGACCTSFSIGITNYLDTLRIRWQMLPQEPKLNSSLFSFGRDIVSKEGFFRGLWIPGCTAHMGAGLISAGIRIGFYPLLRDFIAGEQEKTPFHMWLAGFTAGAAGFALSNPFFKAKVMIQTGMPYTADNPRKGTFRTLVHIYQRESLQGLFKGSSILMARGALLNSGAQLGYDYTKTTCLRHQVLSEGPALHLFASLMSALLAVTFCTPADFLLTRYQASQGRYRGVMDCFLDVSRKNHPSIFFTGWTPLLIRLGPLFTINMPLYEQFRRLVGLSYLH